MNRTELCAEVTGCFRGGEREYEGDEQELSSQESETCEGWVNVGTVRRQCLLYDCYGSQGPILPRELGDRHFASW